jgi:hypothetical protein
MTLDRLEWTRRLRLSCRCGDEVSWPSEAASQAGSNCSPRRGCSGPGRILSRLASLPGNLPDRVPARSLVAVRIAIGSHRVVLKTGLRRNRRANDQAGAAFDLDDFDASGLRR